MKIFIPILFLLTTNNLISQETKYEYFDSLAYSGYESFIIINDSFNYNFSAELMLGKTSGTIITRNDTLILNSDLQPFKVINEYFIPSKKNQFVLSVRNSTYQVKEDDFSMTMNHHIGFRLYNKKELIQEISWRDSNIVQDEYDTVENVIKYYFNPESLPKNYKLKFVVFRTNLEFPLNFNSTTNQIEIVFNELPDITDYTFFTDQKLVYTENGIALVKNGKLERTIYLYESKKGIRRSKKTIVKEYKTAPNKK